MNTVSEELFIDTGSSQCRHFAEKACGDAVAFRRIEAEERLIGVLADGLGHGLKANILALMTTTMALKFVAEDREIIHSAEIIMDSLPVCQERMISYATFTIVDTRVGGQTNVVEMGNPEFMLVRSGKLHPVSGREISSPKYRDRAMTTYSFTVQPQDRIIFFSDGVTQSGMGSKRYPLGWRREGAARYIEELIAAAPDISAQELSEKLVREAVAHEQDLRPADDISAACFHYRKVHKMLLFTGPPFDPKRDAGCARLFSAYDGSKVICGGTSAEIISRELKLPLELKLSGSANDLPPPAHMDGADLVTEGIFTLTRAARYLESGESARHDPAMSLVKLMLKNDRIEFLVGTRINEAHQDPNLPVDLELRRNIVKRLSAILRDRYMKDVRITFV